MAGIFVYSREAIRVKVKKCEGFLQPEYRKFSVDPQITSFEVLQSLLAKAFDIKGDFTVCYRTFDDYGQETFLPLLSDWDLDAAFLSASDPYLCLQVDMKPFEESSDEWEVGPIDVVRTQAPEHKPQNRLPGIIMNQVERTFNMVQRALNLVEDQQTSITNQPPRPPLADAEFRKFLDPIGQVVQSRELRTVIYLGGIEPSLRKVVWKHILNVYPDGLSGKERMDYMKRKALEYQSLRDCWRNMVQNGQVTGDLQYVTSMVRKDVLRTDRHHRFYAGSDDNQNIASLFNILTTYALNHPTVSYCQGMSDLASPLLVTMGDEAHAYICFCALMKRLQTNFMLDGVTMTLKFQHLAEGLMYYDPEFYAYLKGHQADDLLFCYRWLLLEMKREFAFDDALRMLEVLWSSLPQMPPDKDLPLFERQFCSQSPGDSPPPISPLLKTPRENAYTKVCALRRQSSAASLHSISNGSIRGGLRQAPGAAYRQNQSLDETIIGSNGRRTGRVKPFASLDDTSIQFHSQSSEKPKSRSTSPTEALSEPENDATTAINNEINNKSIPSKREISVSTGSLLSKVAEKKDRLKELKEKFASEKAKSMFASFDKSISESSKVESQFNAEKKRVVKNLNEFLNFASFNKNRLLHSLSPKQEVCQMVRESSVISEDSDKTLSGDGDSCRDSIIEDINSVPVSGDTLDDLTPQNELQKDDVALKMASNTSKQRNSDEGPCDCSSPDDSAEYFPMTTSMTRELRLELENLDRHVFGQKFNQRSFPLEDSEDLESPCSESFRSIELKIEPGGTVQKCDCVLSKQESDLPSEDTTTEVAEICSAPINKHQGLVLNLDKSWHQSNFSKGDQRNDSMEKDDSQEKDKASLEPITKINNFSQNYSPGPTLGAGEEIFVWENPLQCPTTPDEQADLEYDGTISSSEGESCFNSSISAGEIFENEGQIVKSVTPIRLLRNAGGGILCRNHTGTSGSPTDDTSDSSDGWGGSTPLKPSHADFKPLGLKGSSGDKSISQTSRTKPRGVRDIQHVPTAPVNAMTNSCEEVSEQVTVSQGGSGGGGGGGGSGSVNNVVSKTEVVKHQDALPSKQLSSGTNIQLPPPHKFGDGNPFLMFLCLTVLLQHRDHIMRSAMDYNEMAMHFDKMVRKHNVTRVLNHARQMYTAYLRHQATLNNNTSHTGMDLNV
ncbi:hypothetical protein R5R35_011751 [Gryllus longicercus]|uniref:Rab-GAP TBC domain-containing protein n=1 Tax=Gryllus longicercus TaxID=2509291 RepID=A0AAN9V507_9ORTH